MWTLQKRGEAQLGLLELGRSSNDLSRVTQRAAPLSQRLLSWLREHFCVPGLFTGPHLPGPCLGLHFRQQRHISIHLSIWCCTNSPKKCAVTFTTNLHNTVCYCRTQTRAFPHLIHPMKMFFSSPPFQKNQVTHLLQAPYLQNFSKATAQIKLSVQIKSQPHALAALEYPFGKPQPAILTLQSSPNKILPYNLEKSSKLSLWNFSYIMETSQKFRAQGKGRLWRWRLFCTSLSTNLFTPTLKQKHSDFKAYWGLGIASLFICSGPVLENYISLFKSVGIPIIKQRLCKCRELWNNVSGKYIVLNSFE